MLTAESFCLRRAYNLDATVADSRARKNKTPDSWSLWAATFSRQGKELLTEAGPFCFFLEKSERLFTGLRRVAKRALQSQEQPYCFDWFGFQWDAKQNWVWKCGVRECLGTHRVILCFFFQSWVMGYSGSSSSDWSVICVRYLVGESRPGNVPLCLCSFLLLSGKGLCL